MKISEAAKSHRQTDCSTTQFRTAGRTAIHVALWVLLAEDDAAVLEALTQLFVALGVKTVAVPDATAATAALDTQFFDVVITDLMMPGGGGRTVVQHVASMGGDRPPVIVMTGRLERALHDEVIAMGAARSIEKPFELRTLLRLVSEVLAAEGH
ncbi:MAG: response regulator [Armatimonadetes bacterium]|nr:response regulator [Armatimonadota bacterium]